MLKEAVSVTGLSTVSSLGFHSGKIWENYLNPVSFIQFDEEKKNYVSQLNLETVRELDTIKNIPAYRNLDKSVWYALLCAKKALAQSKLQDGMMGVNIGSSRGATELFEKYHSHFLNKEKLSTLASPTTTLGNISSWVAQEIMSSGPVISHSITCSTSFHAVLNGIAWMQADLCSSFLAGGSEAALTPFTFSQMNSLKICTKKTDSPYPSRALDLDKTENSMVLGEGAGIICMEKGNKENALFRITGIGYANEHLKHSISITEDAECFQKSMKMALKNHDIHQVDAIVMHAPGTVKGDKSEYLAIQKVFGKRIPLCTTNKWKMGHTFGASGVLSMELAYLMMKNQTFIGVPYINVQNFKQKLNTILINSVGFGGNAVSVLISL